MRELANNDALGENDERKLPFCDAPLKYSSPAELRDELAENPPGLAKVPEADSGLKVTTQVISTAFFFPLSH